MGNICEVAFEIAGFERPSVACVDISTSGGRDEIEGPNLRFFGKFSLDSVLSEDVDGVGTGNDEIVAFFSVIIQSDLCFARR